MPLAFLIQIISPFNYANGQYDLGPALNPLPKSPHDHQHCTSARLTTSVTFRDTASAISSLVLVRPGASPRRDSVAICAISGVE